MHLKRHLEILKTFHGQEWPYTIQLIKLFRNIKVTSVDLKTGEILC
jgi:hypothetical protein